MIATLKIYGPNDGPETHPYTVVITTAAGTVEVPCETQDEAYEVRDAAFDAGHTARIIGLPTVATVAWHVHQLPDPPQD